MCENVSFQTAFERRKGCIVYNKIRVERVHKTWYSLNKGILSSGFQLHTIPQNRHSKILSIKKSVIWCVVLQTLNARLIRR